MLQEINHQQVCINPDLLTVSYQGKLVNLRRKEYEILRLFLELPNRVLNCESIIELVWDLDKIPTHSSIRSHIKAIRQAFQKVGLEEQIIESVYGWGYRLNPIIKKQEVSSCDNQCPYKPDQCIHNLFSSTQSLFYKLISAPSTEYIAINEFFLIQFFSNQASTYSNFPELLNFNTPLEQSFPEFIGLENLLKKVMNQEIKNLGFKGITKKNRNHFFLYFNCHIIKAVSLEKNHKNPLLFIFFENASTSEAEDIEKLRDFDLQPAPQLVTSVGASRF